VDDPHHHEHMDEAYLIARGHSIAVVNGARYLFAPETY
jgi:mannose-6-phosphate isomerase-like protein (cupin superfamily)